MTSKTGVTKITLQSTLEPPTFAQATGGAVAMTGALMYLWVNYTTAKDCILNPVACLSNLKEADPWGRQVVLTACMCFSLWVVSVINRTEKGGSDPSIVDRLWSILPVLYTWHWTFSNNDVGSNPRLCVMAVLSAAWGLRLTYNFAIKGGFSGGEDYRWEMIRGWFPGWKWEVFNFFFICFYQQFLILGFSAPAAVALQYNVPWGSLDTIATGLFLVLLVGEATADAQMYAFQTEKYRRIRAKEPLKELSKGFIDTGLYSISRHPNYFCEVSMWWCFYLFSVSAMGGAYLNWSILGVIFLTILFVVPGNGSLDCAEHLSSGKYPEYKDYQKRVSRFIPWFPRAKK